MIKMETNSAVIVLEKMGAKRREVEIAKVMLRDGDDIHRVSRITGLSIDKVVELQTELQSGQAV